MIRDILQNRKNPDQAAVFEQGRMISYNELIRKAAALQKHLPQEQNRNIAVFLPNGADYIAAFWGTVSYGKAVLPLNILMTGHEIVPILKQVLADTVITSVVFRELFEGLSTDEELWLNIIYMEEIDTIAGKAKMIAAATDEDRPMVLLNTSGTTGKSKIVSLSARNVESSVKGYLAKLELAEGEPDGIRLLLAVPFSSVYGIMILSACLMMALPLVLSEGEFTLSSFYQAIESCQITHYEGSASVILMLEQMAGRNIPYDIRSFRYLGFGGSKVSGNSIANVMNRYPQIEFSQGYGMTEASPLIAKRPRGTIGKEESAGTAIDGVEIAIETESGITGEPGVMGEILVKGPSVMLGYYDNKAETEAVIKQGYLHTGDIGYLDKEGFLYICGRKKNVMIVRGFNVYPEEVEACVQNSLLVKDCFAYGMTDDLGHEIVCLDVIPVHPDIREREIWEYCRSHLAEFKQPQRIIICESIKKNLSGKTERGKEQ